MIAMKYTSFQQGWQNYLGGHSMNKEVAYCKRCGRKLKSEEAKARGYGLICFKKAQKEKSQKKLF